MASRIVTAGLNKFLDATLKTGLTSPAWYVGLVGATNTYAAGDILSSHAGWAEDANYSGNRKAFTPGTIATGAVDNSASKAVFAVTGSGPFTINGAFVCDASSGTSGTLLGEGDFTGGSKSVNSGDTLNVTVTFTLTTA